MLAAMFEKSNKQTHFCLYRNRCVFMWGAYFYIGGFKSNVVVKWVPIIMGCLFSMGKYYSDFMVCSCGIDSIYLLITCQEQGSLSYYCQLVNNEKLSYRYSKQSSFAY